LSIGPSKGEYRGQLQSRAYIVELPLLPPGAKATVDGVAVTPAYDPAGKIYRISIPERSVRRGVMLRMTAEAF